MVRGSRALWGAWLAVILAGGGACAPGAGAGVPDEEPAGPIEVVEGVEEAESSEEVVFVFEGERYEAMWFESPDGLFRIALPQGVEGLDVEVSEAEWVQMDGVEEVNLLAHTEDPEGVALRGRIALAAQQIEDPLERSEYRERFVQTLWHDHIFEERADREAEYAGVAGALWDRSWYFRPRERDQELRRVLYRAALWQLEVDATVWSFVVIAPEEQQEQFLALFQQALETLELRR